MSSAAVVIGALRVKTGDLLTLVHLHCILVYGTKKGWLLKTGEPFIGVVGLSVY